MLMLHTVLALKTYGHARACMHTESRAYSETVVYMVQACMCVSERLVFNLARCYGHRGTYLNNESTVSHCDCTHMYPSLPAWLHAQLSCVNQNANFMKEGLCYTCCLTLFYNYSECVCTMMATCIILHCY